MNGAAFGGGFALGIYSKFRIATESTVVAMPDSKFGFYRKCIFDNFIGNFVRKEEAVHMAIFSHKYIGLEVYIKKYATHYVKNEFLPDLLNELQNIKKI